jgi:hypothetical protein
MTAGMACLRPVWASETTSWTPWRPRAFSDRRNAVQKAPSSLSPTSKPKDFPAAVGGDPGGDDDRAADHPAVDAGLGVGGVHEQVREGGVRQRARAERRDLGVQLGAAPADLRLGDAGIDAQGADQVVDLAGGGAVDVGLHHDRQQRPVDAPAGFQQRREERALPQFWDAQFDVAGLGGQ